MITPNPEGVTLIPSSDGVQIAVHDLGGPTDPSAPVLLFSHATGFHGRVWGPLSSELTSTYRCLAIDHRGHGVTVTPGEASLEWSRLGGDVIAVLDSALIGPQRAIHGVAHSMGGAALVLAAAHRPAAFRSLWLYEPVIVGPGMLPPPDGPDSMAEGAARRRDTFDSLDQAFENYASKPPLNQLRPDALRSYVDGGFAPQPDGTVTLRCRPATEAAVYRGAAHNGAWDVLHDLHLPVAMVVGRPEEFGPVTFAGPVTASLPQGTLIERRELGHFGPLQDPTAMGRDVESWVKDHTSAPVAG
jgi:pimeloyl-ACP methyl ester carboxylesterase